MTERTIPRTVVGGITGGGVFIAVSLYQNVMVEQGIFSNPGPVLAMGVIGFTVGALAGPLVGGIVDRIRRGQ